MVKKKIGLIGTGWRAGFFVRCAKMLPDRFELVGTVYHSPEGRKTAEGFKAPVFPDAVSLVREAHPDYVIVCVSRKSGAAAEYVRQLIEMNVPVLMETPPADSLEDLTAFFLETKGAPVQIAEQYQFQPLIAARIAIAHSGQLGTVYQSHLNLPNGYHAISVHRRLLDVGMALPKIWAHTYTHERMAGPTRAGDPLREEMISVNQMVFHLDYGDKQAFNDLEGDQCRPWIRGDHAGIRGTRGEIFDQDVYYMKDFETPVHYVLERMMAGANTNLEGLFLRGVRGQEGFAYENPFRPARMFDDEIAVATTMQKMSEFIDGAPSFYSVAQASQDSYLGLLTTQAAKEERILQAEKQIWME